LDPKKVDELVESMKKLGQLSPIGVYADNPNRVRSAKLVFGLHRLEARKKQGHKDIDVIFVTGNSDADRKLAEIAENLHRAELDEVARSAHLTAWADIIRQQGEADAKAKAETEAAKPKRGRGRPPGSKNKNKGEAVHDGPKAPSKTRTKATSDTTVAKKMGVSRQILTRAQQIDKIVPEAKEAAKAAGVADQKDLLKVAKVPPEQQVAKVAEIATAKARGPEQTYGTLAEFDRAIGILQRCAGADVKTFAGGKYVHKDVGDVIEFLQGVQHAKLARAGNDVPNEETTKARKALNEKAAA
jgi:ParB-like chromosome segregation protein Spo0J